MCITQFLLTPPHSIFASPHPHKQIWNVIIAQLLNPQLLTHFIDKPLTNSIFLSCCQLKAWFWYVIKSIITWLTDTANYQLQWYKEPKYIPLLSSMSRICKLINTVCSDWLGRTGRQNVKWPLIGIGFLFGVMKVFQN